MRIINKLQILLILLISSLFNCEEFNCGLQILKQLKQQNVNYTVDRGQIKIINQSTVPLNISASNCNFSYEGNSNSFYISNQIEIESIAFSNITFEKGISEGLVLSANTLKLNRFILDGFDIKNEHGLSITIAANNININSFIFNNDVEFKNMNDNFVFQIKISISQYMNITSYYSYIKSWQKYNVIMKAGRSIFKNINQISNIARIATDSFTQNQDISLSVEDSLVIDNFQQTIYGEDQKFVSCDSIFNIQSNSFKAESIQVFNSSLWVSYTKISSNIVTIQKLLFQKINITNNRFIIEDIGDNECQNQLINIVSPQQINIAVIEVNDASIKKNRYIRAASQLIQVDSIIFPLGLQNNLQTIIYDSGFSFEHYDGESSSSLIIKKISTTNLNLGQGSHGLFIIKDFNKIQLSGISIIQDQNPNENFYLSNSPIIKQGGFFYINNCSDVTIAKSKINFIFKPFFYSLNGGVFALINCSNLSISDIQFYGGQYKKSQVSTITNQKGGFIYILNSQQVNINYINATNCIVQGDGGFGYLEGNLLIQNSHFDNCYSSASGGTFFLTNNGQVELNNTVISNSVSDLFGGAIYIQNIFLTFKSNNFTISNCQSQIGGGVMGQIQEQQSGVIFKNNTSILYGDNYSPLIDSIIIKTFGELNIEVGSEYYRKEMEFTQKEINDQVYIEIDKLHNLQIYFIEFEFVVQNKIISARNQSMIQLTQIAQSNSQDINFKIEQQMQNQKSSFYIVFQMDIQTIESIERIQSLIQIYTYKLQINGMITQECFPGQIQKPIKQTCQYCQNFNYKPKNSNDCNACSINIYDDCYADVSKIKKGYWRENDTNEIYQCPINSSNCKGGKEYGNNLCEEGRVGEECLECDLKNIRDQGEYSRSSFFECSRCSQIKYNLILIIIAGVVGLLFFILVFMIIQAQQKAILIKRYLNATKLVYFGTSYEKCNYSGSYLKLLTFYLQIITICSYQSGNPILKNIILFQINLYTPLSPAFISVDCYLQQLGINFFSIPYLRILITVAIPFLVALGFILYLSFKSIFTQKKENIIQQKNIQEINLPENENEQQKVLQNLSTVLIPQQVEISKPSLITNKNILFQVISFLFFSLFAIPITDQMVSSCLCRQFQSSNQFSIIDFTLPCDDQMRQIIAYGVFIPLLLFFSLILPLFLFYKLFKNRTSLDDKQVQFLFGYIFKEYKRKYYFWEFIRFVFRLILIFNVYYFYDNFSNMAIGSIIVLGVYLIILINIFPFVRRYYNYLEIILVTSSIFMLLAYFKKQNQNESTSLIVFIYFVNIQALLFVGFLLVQFLRYSITNLLVKFNIYPKNTYSQRTQDNIKKFRIISKIIMVTQKQTKERSSSSESITYKSIKALEVESSSESKSINQDQFLSLNQYE